MKKSRFTEEQILSVMRETDRDTVPVVSKQHGVSEQTIYAWQKRFGSFRPDDVRRLKQLEQENARLKKPVAEHDLEIEVMKKIAAKDGELGAVYSALPARREQVAYAMRRGLSQCRSCMLLNDSRSALGYRSAKAVKDAPALARMAALSAQYPRFGYRRIRIFLGREGRGGQPVGRSSRGERSASLRSGEARASLWAVYDS